MPEKTQRNPIVIGHKNPDTDSICSAICYANLKTKSTGRYHEPARAGKINGETQYVLDYFGVEAPKLVEDVRTQVMDIEIRLMEGVNRNISLKKAWNMMQANNAVTLPVVTDKGAIEGLITVGDITKSYMNIYDSSILSKANTQYSNILETLEGDLVVGNADAYFNQGKVLVAAANPDLMEFYIEPHDLVILGNRYESQLCAIEMEADCIIVCEGAGASMTIRKLAEQHGCTVIATAYDTYTTARLINQSMPVSYFMTTDKLIAFEEEDYIDEIREVMASKRHRDFPILDKNGLYKGMISRRNLLGATGKQVILVDHNERNQAVDGVAAADIREIIDHHRLGTVETISPVFFRNQPLGCTATIVYQMYQEAGIEIEKQIAGLLCSAIISDTLLFRSPTCTAVDRAAAMKLADIAGVEIEKYAGNMFAAGSNLKGKNDSEIFYQDFKTFTAGKTILGVAQVSSLNEEELADLRERMGVFIKQAKADRNMDMMFFMLTNIVTESTDLIYEGQGAEQLVIKAFHLENDGASEEQNWITLPGVVSRKKQLVPALVLAEQE
ncbi:MAG: putative manganese-dependent inorganic diphosphatase [Lachnospiraceae bacterium]|nr:putative manganese-dependent inorganic diphosphatase [Lachnospiraceae bacterium]MCI9590694.1 putative manganese-dependent inorganic diphosphatase [Lachnospiraceae bacterium]